MKAIVYEKYGSPDVFQLRDVDAPFPGDDEVLIKVHAVSINDWDLGLLDGTSFVNRMINGLFRPRRTILGSDVAGTVVSVGKNVKSFKPDDDVFGDLSGRWGGFAEYVCAPAAAVALKPRSMSFAEAAAIPQAGMLAVQGLQAGGELKPGQKILINGAGGGVGTFAVQLAKPHGVEITGVDSASKLGMLQSMGFDSVIDYAKEDFTKNGIQYDLILDVKTNRPIRDYMRALSPNGIYLTVGGSISRLLQVLVLWPLLSIGSRKSGRVVSLKPNKDLAYMCELFEAGRVKPVIDSLRPLEELPEAMKHFALGKHMGKVVITLEQR
jgi:NADPH:quinone reductase-like Zn-dependent oxidoreductase